MFFTQPLLRLVASSTAWQPFCPGGVTLMALAVTSLSVAQATSPTAWTTPKTDGSLRIATFNVSFHRSQAGQLQRDLQAQDPQIEQIASLIRSVQPDILLLNEVDRAEETDNARAFAESYLAAPKIDRLGNPAWSMPHVYSAAVNTGVASGMDLNRNGQLNDPEDAWGFGRFPGQYGMAVLSRFEIDREAVRTLQKFCWSQVPQAMQPRQPDTGEAYYAPETWQQLRLASKSFWDVPIQTPLGRLHVLASHPTPPAFDGPEDRNGCRNHDEIQLIRHYIEGSQFLVGDDGRPAGLGLNDAFVVLGDLNSDPHDGDSQRQAIQQLLAHPRIARAAAPRSSGGLAAAQLQAGVNTKHRGDAAEDTADFNDRSVGNLRIDYVLPSTQLEVVASGVLWPRPDDLPAALRPVIEQALSASDHHLVWIDARLR